MKMSHTCQNCGNVVSDNFARVCGDNQGNVHHCMNCIPEDEGGRELLRRGAAAFEDLDVAKKRIEM